MSVGTFIKMRVIYLQCHKVSAEVCLYICQFAITPFYAIQSIIIAICQFALFNIIFRVITNKLPAVVVAVAVAVAAAE